MTDVATLRPAPKPGPRQEVVELLREMLTRAESGEIDVVVIAAGLSGEEAVVFRSTTSSLTTMIGYLERAKARLFATDVEQSWGPVR